MQSNNNGGGSGGGQEEAIKIPQAILNVMQNRYLDVDDIRLRWLMMRTCPLSRTSFNKTLTTTITTTISCRVGSIVGFAHIIQTSE